jgi:hypothetical protein
MGGLSRTGDFSRVDAVAPRSSVSFRFPMTRSTAYIVVRGDGLKIRPGPSSSTWPDMSKSTDWPGRTAP